MKKPVCIRFDVKLLGRLDSFIKRFLTHKDRTGFIHDAVSEHLIRERRKLRKQSQ